MLLYIHYKQTEAIKLDEKQHYKQKDHLTYPEATMYQLVEKCAEQFYDAPAYEFYDRKTSYGKFIERIQRAARAFYASGIRMGDAVTICLPNILYYAIYTIIKAAA